MIFNTPPSETELFLLLVITVINAAIFAFALENRIITRNGPGKKSPWALLFSFTILIFTMFVSAQAYAAFKNNTDRSEDETTPTQTTATQHDLGTQKNTAEQIDTEEPS
jgi:hypothetical protein